MRFDLEQHREAIEALCRQYAVKKLEIFGSAARDDFDAASSDVDFIVVFDHTAAIRGLRQFMGFKFALEALFGREVDLVESGALENPYFVADIANDRRLVYAA